MHREVASPPTVSGVNDSVFALSSALSSMTATLDSGAYAPADGADGPAAFLLARGLRSEITAAHPDLEPPVLACLTAGMAFGGLESRDIAYHPQELLAANLAVNGPEAASEGAPSLLAAVFSSMSEGARVRNLILLSAGVLVAGAGHGAGTTSERIARYREVFAEGLVSPVDWDTIGSDVTGRDG